MKANILRILAALVKASSVIATAAGAVDLAVGVTIFMAASAAKDALIVIGDYLDNGKRDGSWLPMLLVAALCLCSVPGCATDKGAVARVGLQYAANKYASDGLKAAESPREWEHTYVRIDAVKSALEQVQAGDSRGGVQALLAVELGQDPEAQAIASALLELIPADADAGSLVAEYVQAIVSGLKMALMAKMPTFNP